MYTGCPSHSRAESQLQLRTENVEAECRLYVRFGAFFHLITSAFFCVTRHDIILVASALDDGERANEKQQANVVSTVVDEATKFGSKLS
jgi:hypothetical protein